MTDLQTFARDIHKGLSAPQKHISSKYFYDDIGSGIFQDIMKMPEYYPTPCEFEILSLQGGNMLDKLNFDEPFQVVEFGAGDGIKTRQLLKKLVERGTEFTYVPIDISARAIEELVANMRAHLPEIRISPMIGNYFTMMEELSQSRVPSLLLFLGGNIGNYENQEVKSLLADFRKCMNPGDYLLTGFDLQKNPATIRCAYDDPKGITKAFNINLLHRINRELGGGFKTNQFDFYSHYNPVNGEVRSYLVSLVPQRVHVQYLDKCYDFDRNEIIWTELSKKYTLPEIESVAETNGFRVVEHFLDCKAYFTDSLWTL
ncbi:dimethylhistidine N-methyltransferase [Dyadobacter beijingensis]|uniref:Dimethylhistidine N-methyltransferase n=1 Tax=Dyadobacter beijingensis TaxID=365489 RepID=A0ABQ2HY24_9BACT|nr:L-histidine N(alpha)-methyltransferase [Dyadobacter beijingensis]GGM93153.1 dimethylhistidine N-methyltransferase [Dyadobacter beijingensis]